MPLQIKILGNGPTSGVANLYGSTSVWLGGLNHRWAPGQQSSRSQICALHNRFSLVPPETLHFWGIFYAYETLLEKPRWKIHRYLLRQELGGLCLQVIFLNFFSRLRNPSVNPKAWDWHANLWHTLQTSRAIKQEVIYILPSVQFFTVRGIMCVLHLIQKLFQAATVC